MSAGSLEEVPEGPEFLRMVTDMKTMAGRLESRNYPNLEIAHYIFDGETHSSGIGAAINRGIKYVLTKSIEIKGTTWEYDGKPSFSINFPEESQRMQVDSPNQVFAARTKEGVTFQAAVNDIWPGSTLDQWAQAYVDGVVSAGIGRNARVTSNTETTLSCGTKAYRSEIQWLHIPSGGRLLTQAMAAFKDGNTVFVVAHPIVNPESVIPIVESLRFVAQ